MPKHAHTKDNKSNKKATMAADQNIPDICKLEFKVGLITKVWTHPDADKLYCEEIDCGEEGGPRQIASGLRKHYTEEEMLGKRVLVVANLKVSEDSSVDLYGYLFMFLDTHPYLHGFIKSLSCRRRS